LAAQQFLQNTHLYPDQHYIELKQALATFLGVEIQQITLGNGSENVLELIIKTYLDKNVNAILSQYAFLTIPFLLQSYGIPIKLVPTLNWQQDISGLLKAIDEKTRIVFLVNPNNPTGTYINNTDFLKLMTAIPPEIIVVVDEAYFEYVLQPDYPQTLKYLSTYPNLILTRTFSKAYGLAGLRVGYAISSPDIATMLNCARVPFNVSYLATKSACAALADQAHLQKTLDLNQLGMQQLRKGLKDLNLNTIPSVGNFLTIEVSNAMLMYQKLLQAGILIKPLNAYQLPNYIRVTSGSLQQNDQFLTTLHSLHI
jgi:histidinol-phosphate aminotransferase